MNKIIHIGTTAPVGPSAPPDGIALLSGERDMSTERYPSPQEDRLIATIVIGSGSIVVNQRDARILGNVLQLFANFGRVCLRDDGLVGWNTGDLVDILLCRADMSWERRGPYRLKAPHNPSDPSGMFSEALGLARDLLDELEAQKPRPVVMAQIVPHGGPLPW